MILVCISRITHPNEQTVHEYGYMLKLEDRKGLGNPGFNPEFWRLATNMEEELWYQGVRNILTVIKKYRL